MPSEYNEYLAANILGDSRVITYRLLSRALKVHVNNAKQMLFEFHRQQNAKKPGSIHATYLLRGTREKDETSTTTDDFKDGDDMHMQNSPFMNSSMPQEQEEQEVTAVQTIILVKEEDLDQIVSSFEQLSSIHVYSLELAPLHNLQTLSDATREVISVYGLEDPMEYGPVYGTIHNKDVRRRAGRQPPLQTASAPPTQKQRVVKEEPKQTSHIPINAKSSQPSASKEFFSKSHNDKKATPSTLQKTASSAPTSKRDSSSIFKSFAKAKPKPKPEATDSSAAPSTQASATEDSPMNDVSDDDEDDYVPPLQVSKENVDRDRRTRTETEAALRKMMEDDDEPESEPISNEEPAEIEESEIITEKLAEPEPVAEVRDGRKRGKRRVMKKKTVKDDEGYLVTREEAVWESFSEDEPVAPKPKTQSTIASTTGKKKPAAKTGQGSIMSFFGKK